MATYPDPRCEEAAPGWPCDGKLMELLGQLQLRACETVPFARIGQYFQPAACRSNVTGVIKAGLPVYWNISKNKTGDPGLTTGGLYERQ
ncbi:hypothetical protein ACUSIJ_09030 [Pseudochelatococcus sp. B33]